MRFIMMLTGLTVAALPALAQKEAPPAPGTPKDFRLPPRKTFTLANGMRVSLVHYGVVPKVAVNLDLATGREIIDLLKKMQRERGVTIITATHDMKMLAASDRVVWIQDGKIDRIEERAALKIEVGTIDGQTE